MKCFKCGMDVLEGSQFCSHCGSSMSTGQAGGAGGQSQGNQSNVNPGTPAYGNQGNMNPGIQAYGNQGNMNPGTQVYGNQGNVNPGFPAYGNQGNMNPGVPFYGNPGNMNLMTPVGENQRKGDLRGTYSIVLGIVSFISYVIAAMIVSAAIEANYEGIDSPFGLLAIIFMFLGIICSLTGLIFAIPALVKKTRKMGMAVAGLICNILLLLGSVVVLSLIGGAAYYLF